MSLPNRSARRRLFPRTALASALGMLIALHASAATAQIDAFLNALTDKDRGLCCISRSATAMAITLLHEPQGFVACTLGSGNEEGSIARPFPGRVGRWWV